MIGCSRRHARSLLCTTFLSKHAFITCLILYPATSVANLMSTIRTHPYGASNSGQSARLFLTRGSELVHSAGRAYLLLPNDRERPWTQKAMQATQIFLLQHGWTISTTIPEVHRYHLDDDPTLGSSLVIADRLEVDAPTMPWAGRHVKATEIPHFYGKSVLPPYPRFISADGREIMNVDVLP